MKKLILLVGLMTAFALQAQTYERTLIEDYTPVAHMDFAFEIKSSKFQKIVLDCQSFITGMTFYQNKKVVHSIYLDAYGDCQYMHDFITTSRAKELPVCLEIENESNTLTVSNFADDCQ